MGSIEKAVAMLIENFKKECGEDAKLENGDEIVGVCHDGIVIIGIEKDELNIKVIAGEPYNLDTSLNLLESTK